MPYCFIISNRKHFHIALSRIIKDETLYDTICITLPPQQEKLQDTQPVNYENPVALLKSIEKNFTIVPLDALRSSVVVVDELISPRFLDPLSSRSGPQQFYAMLMLAFPELQFVFLNTTGLPSQQICLLAWLENAKSRNQMKSYESCQLFDPHGMRETIKLNLLDKHEDVAPIFPQREQLALSIEDESSYVLFNAYAAYKSFYKCKVVNSLGHLDNLKNEIDYNQKWQKHIKEAAWLSENKFELKLLFDDLFLNFYDRVGTVELSNITKRYEKYEVLRSSEKKVLITVGEPTDNKEQDIKKLFKYIIEKPGKGFYHLKSEAELLGNYKEKRDLVFGKNAPKRTKAPVESANNHSTPGRLLIIAESLLSRAEALLDQTKSVPRAINAATLALDAKELLGTLTPTASLQALAVQHKAEIAAESLFYGVEYEMHLGARFEDIQAETEAISKRFKIENQEKQALNAYLNLVEQLAKEFNNWNQFDEELACLNEARKVRHKLKSMDSGFFIRPMRKFAYWYVDNCISSLGFHYFVILCWILGFAFLFWLITLPCVGHTFGVLECLCIDISQSLSPWDALLVSLASFFTIDTSPDWVSNRLNGHSLYVLLFVIQSIIAFLHLSLLVAYIFMKLSRR